MAKRSAKGEGSILDAAYKIISSPRYVTSGLNELGSKLAAPTSDWSAMSATDHFVQFYEGDEYLVDSVSEYIYHGLRMGEICVVIATAEHRSAIEDSVESFGFDLDAARNEETYISLDADEMLATFMISGQLDGRLFRKEIGGLIRKATARGPVRAFGEMVAVLVRQGEPAAAVKLEELWNRLRKKHNFSLFCAYPTSDFAQGDAAKFIGRVCGEHSRVIPDESYMSLTSADERLRNIALLQQRGRQLEAELTELRHRIAEKGPNLLPQLPAA